jgi:hypothetical protein
MILELNDEGLRVERLLYSMISELWTVNFSESMVRISGLEWLRSALVIVLVIHCSDNDKDSAKDRDRNKDTVL